MREMDVENDLPTILGQFSRLKVLVMGEAILDSNVRGRAGRLSLEGPAPVVEVTSGQDLPGGAANVAVNASRLGASVELLSAIGEDVGGDLLLDQLRLEGIEVSHVLRCAERATLLKRRVYAGSQLLLRYDQGSTGPVDAETERRLLRDFELLCPRVDVVILADYGLGVLTHRVLQGIARFQAESPCVLVADTRRLDEYHGLRLAALRPSYPSALEMLDARSFPLSGPSGNGNPFPMNGKSYPGNDRPLPDAANGEAGETQAEDSLAELSAAGERILAELDTQLVTITLDDNGALVLDRDTEVYRTYAPHTPINRVGGAGDAFISALALSLAAGAPASAAGEIASAAAAIVVHKDGLAACCLEELRAALDGDQKLVEDWSALETRLDALRREGKKIVFTNGVFDILHSAHVNYLNQAKSFGDILVIGVNSDESVKRLKGPTRPINGLIERCRVLSGLSCVDFVVPFSEDNPINLLHHVRPAVYVKGGDYTRETLPEAAVVEGYGGVLHLVPYIANHSTTGVIERIRKIES